MSCENLGHLIELILLLLLLDLVHERLYALNHSHDAYRIPFEQRLGVLTLLLSLAANSRLFLRLFEGLIKLARLLIINRIWFGYL